MSDIDGLFRNSLNKQGKPGEGKTEQAQANEPGTAYNRLSSYTNFARHNETQVHRKTLRTLCTQDKGLNDSVINLIAALDTFLMLFNKHHANKDIFTDWTGAATYWKRQQSQALRQAIERGYIEEYKDNILPSPRGEKVLRDYNIIFEEAKENYIMKAEAKKTPAKRKKTNIRIPGEPSARL